MNRFVFALVAIMGVVTGARLATAESYSENNKTVTQDCSKDPEVTVLGNDNTITLINTCAKLSVVGNKNKVTAASAVEVEVDGNNNTVTVAATDHVNVPGNHNTVTWTKGVKTAKPAVSNTGHDNKITQRK